MQFRIVSELHVVQVLALVNFRVYSNIHDCFLHRHRFLFLCKQKTPHMGVRSLIASFAEIVLNKLVVHRV